MFSLIRNFDKPMQMKTVIDTNNSGSYFRKAKPFTSSFIAALKQDDLVVAEEVLLLEECADLLPEKHVVKLLFYNDSNQLLQLLIGTGALD
jgi:hypothetical protein